LTNTNILKGNLPFWEQGLTATQVRYNISTAKYPIYKSFSLEFCQLLASIFEVNKKKRITIHQLKLHPWFTNKNIKSPRHLKKIAALTTLPCRSA